MTPAEFKERRNILKLSQAGLGDLIGLRKLQILRYENAHAPIPKAIAMLMVLLTYNDF